MWDIICYVASNTLIDTKHPDYHSAIKEDISGFEYVIIKINSSERKHVEVWEKEMVQYLYAQHKKGKKVAITVLDASDMVYKMDNLHVITTLQVMSLGNELGFTYFHIFNVLPKKGTGPLIRKAIMSVVKIVNTFAGKKYKFRVSFVDEVNESRKRIHELIEKLQEK